MISRISFGWQTTMADLAMILFMVTAAGISAQQQQKPQSQLVPVSRSQPAQGEPLAIYRAHTNAPPISDWLAEQAPDQRQYLTIVARYQPGNVESAARKAVALAQEAGMAGVPARIVLEPGEGAELLATLAFDRPETTMARPLHTASQD